MVKAKGWKGVVLREVVYEKIQKTYEEYRKTKPFTTLTDFLNNYLWEVLEYDEYLRRHAPGLQFIGLDQNVVYVKDHFIDRIVEVEIHDEGISKRFLYCRHCERDDCLHVGFCFAIREVNKVLVERGFKQPKASKEGNKQLSK